MAKKGELFQKGTLGPDGYVEFWEEGSQVEWLRLDRQDPGFNQTETNMY